MEKSSGSKRKSSITKEETEEKKKLKKNSNSGEKSPEKVTSPEKNKTTKNENSSSNWDLIGSVLVKDYGTTPSQKILSFDLDDTIVRCKSGKTFALNSNDYEFIQVDIAKLLKNKIDEGFKIVIFTNQGGISNGKTERNMWQKKLDNIQKELGIPLQVFAATEDDYNRKPCVGMWKLFEDKFNGGIIPDKKDTIYVGDAAGRPERGKIKKDHSDTDYKFAVNVGLVFYTPEKYYEGKVEELPEFKFDPKQFKIADQSLFKNISLKDELEKIKPESVELLILVGPPGSGKSSFYHNYLKNNGYIHINQDTLKTAQKCLSNADSNLSQGKSVVIDNTNPQKEVRAKYVKIAKKHKAKVRCFVFNFSKDLCFHLNNLRDINPYKKHYSKSVADVIIHTWFKKFEMPDESEGIDEVLEVNFRAGPFENKEDEEVFYYWS